MSKLIVHSGLRVSGSPKGGFGVFADENILMGDIIEQCPIVICDEWKKPKVDDNYLVPHNISRYTFNWKFNDIDTTVVVLGYGAVYNHDNNNVDYYSEVLIVDGEHKEIMTYIAKRDISIGEELCVNYGPQYFKYFNIEEK